MAYFSIDTFISMLMRFYMSNEKRRYFQKIHRKQDFQKLIWYNDFLLNEAFVFFPFFFVFFLLYFMLSDIINNNNNENNDDYIPFIFSSSKPINRYCQNNETVSFCFLIFERKNYIIFNINLLFIHWIVLFLFLSYKLWSIIILQWNIW